MGRPILRLEFKGLDKLSRNLRKGGEADRRVRNAAIQAVTFCAEDLARRAGRDAPLDKGDLEASITAEVRDDNKTVSTSGAEGPGFQDPKDADTIVGFVGSNLPYAAAQEFREDFAHPKKGKAHYIGDNLDEQEKTYRRHFAEKLRDALR